MAPSHGKDSYFSLDDTADSPTDVSAYFDSITGLPGGIEMADVTTFTAEDHSFIAGLDAVKTISLSGPYNSTFDGLVGTSTQRKVARDFIYGPGGNATPKWAGSCFISGYETPASTTDAVRMTVTLQVSGAVTRS